MSLGKIIKEYRKSHNITMQEFANACGLSKGYISMLEHDRHPQNNKKVVPSLKTYTKLSAGMHMPLNELLSLLPDDAPIFLSNDVSASSLTENELELLAFLNDLNEEGQEALINYAHYLSDSGQYKKHCEPELVEA